MSVADSALFKAAESSLFTVLAIPSASAASKS